MSLSRVLAATTAALLLPASTLADVPAPLDVRAMDRTGSPLAREVGATLSRTLERRAQNAFTGTVPGWTITEVGNVIFLKDDGTHGCSGALDNAWFDACIAGTNGAVDAFYAAYPTANPGFLNVMTAWDTGFGGAFYSPVANDVEGIGYRNFTGGQDTFGNAGSLNGFIFLNSLPFFNEFGAGYREVLFDMFWGQEFGHRWGAFVHFDDDGTESTALLGRDDAHWSYFVDSDWSWMEGNDWRDNGDGSFTTNHGSFGDVPGFSPLDLYLMGLIPASAVPDFLLIENPSGNYDPEDGPQVLYGNPATITGKKKMVSIDDILAVEGPRSPSFAQAKRRFQTTFLVVFRSVDNTDDTTLRALAAEYAGWASDHFRRDTSNLGYVHIGWGPMPSNANPTVELTAPETATKGKTVTLDASASADADGDSLSYVWDFGDGTGAYGAAEVVEHAFAASGDLTVTLTVVDENGGARSTTRAISVAKPKDDGLLGCGCSLAPKRTGGGGWLGSIALIAFAALGFLRRRR